MSVEKIEADKNEESNSFSHEHELKEENGEEEAKDPLQSSVPSFVLPNVMNYPVEYQGYVCRSFNLFEQHF